ncbi:hypothetical protein SSPIM334S_04382 [Streptomyces spiroverticillatus]
MEKCRTARSASAVTSSEYSGHAVTSLDSAESLPRTSRSVSSPAPSGSPVASCQAITGAGGSFSTRW